MLFNYVFFTGKSESFVLLRDIEQGCTRLLAGPGEFVVSYFDYYYRYLFIHVHILLRFFVFDGARGYVWLRR